ncbi:DUF6807 family protein [Streptosporangium roseum]|uniref:Dehydrogenase-like protein n=1 Tax=Streptosporangium roseum (strain ATCC 12428 / DSM 43021 / JCM 3005 / KCTC 9067 / NCIMB 10171 / NRRL 2505 / NI 9100) TaxID=479432 RepID=D2AQE5_STRRD|nr:dehydrogenase-like protein [Streptosporangium roseum DSM 43021]
MTGRIPAGSGAGTARGGGTAPVRVVLAGAHGHGWWHLSNLRRLHSAGTVEFAGVCDLRPVEGLPEGVEFSGDLAELIGRTGAEVTILCTPIQTHADLAVRALRAGSHLLLEKPPAATFAGYERIAAVAGETGLACQVGFQSLGSEAVPAVRKMIADGVVGRVTGIGAAGAWERSYPYYSRVPWAGRRRLDGVPVVDGALTNPLAHAVATALAVSGAGIDGIEVELYRANAIEADDTSCVRLRMDDGTAVTVAVSLCADRRHEPYLIVHGETGRIRLTYTEDRVEIGGTSVTHPRTDLLENLVAHVRDGADLLVPLERTAGFMRVLEAVRLAPDPLPIPERFQEVGEERRVLPGIARVTAESAERLALYSELGLPWALAAGTAGNPTPAERRTAVTVTAEREAPAGPPDLSGAGTVALDVSGVRVAEYVVRAEVPVTSSPRPYLHPVRTLGGTAVTEVAPADHVHHLGVSVAVSDVGGANFWGGRTYVRDRGPAWLGDHGTQRHLGFSRRDPAGFGESLAWVGPDGTELARETREVRATGMDGCWALDFSFTLTNLTGDPLPVRSSATKGRAGAGYGGFFWRAPGSARDRRVFTEDAEGEDAVHGSRAPWLAMSSAEWTLVFVQRADPWFVRVVDYPGAGPALAWDTPLLVEDTLTRRVVTVVADGPLSRSAAAALASEVSP